MLAGGRGSRMGGVDKGLQPFRGEPLLTHVLRRLAPQVDTLLISANGPPERYAAFGLRVIADPDATQAGPLAGILAGLIACRTELLAVVPCDAPFMPADLIRRLAADFVATRAGVAVARTASGLQPTFCLMRSTMRDDLAAFIDGGGRAIHRWLDRIDHREVSFDDEASFVNLNTPADLRAAEGRGDPAS